MVVGRVVPVSLYSCKVYYVTKAPCEEIGSTLRIRVLRILGVPMSIASQQRTLGVGETVPVLVDFDNIDGKNLYGAGHNSRLTGEIPTPPDSRRTHTQQELDRLFVGKDFIFSITTDLHTMIYLNTGRSITENDFRADVWSTDRESWVKAALADRVPWRADCPRPVP